MVCVNIRSGAKKVNRHLLLEFISGLRILGIFILFGFSQEAYTAGMASPDPARCLPVSAKLCVAGDDITDIWIDGSYLGTKEYCDLRKGCTPDTLCLPVPLQMLPDPEVCLAIKTVNKNPVMVYSSWELEVDCSGDKTFILNSENPARSGVSLYWDPTGGVSCGQGATPPIDGKGRSWTEQSYQPDNNPFTVSGASVTANTWTAAQIKNVRTGMVMSYISYDPNAVGTGAAQACGVLYWRQVGRLPVWIPTATPTVVFTSTKTYTPTSTFTPSWTFTTTYTYTTWPTPTETQTPLPIHVYIPRAIPTDTPQPAPTSTPVPIRRIRVAPTATPVFKPRFSPPVRERSIKIQPTPTFIWIRPTRTPTLVPWLNPTPIPKPTRNIPHPLPDWLSKLDKAQTILFQTPPVDIYVTFADGPGRYELVIVDGQGNPLATIYNQKVVAQSDAWVTWDGKDSHGSNVRPGKYFAIFYRNGILLRSISVFRSGGGTTP
jgi:hypothetical protein